MRASSSTSHETAHAIGELCAGGHWACAHGDFSTLRHIARSLAGRVSEPLCCELIALADACIDDPDRAAALWIQLKDGLFQTGES